MKVAVVGAGLAGIRSAMLLERAGHEVELFEARQRAGGRLHTRDSGFETGAEWVDEDHDRMRALMRELGIAEVPAPPGDYLLCFQNQKCMENQPWPQAEQDAIRFESLAKSATAADGSTIADLVYASCFSHEGRWMVSANIRTDEGDEPERLSLAAWLQFRNKYAQRDGNEGSAIRIDGGGRSFIEAMLSKLNCAPVYGSELRSIREGASVELTFEGFSASADAVILALPLPCLNEILIDPPLAVEGSLKRLGTAPVVKARLGFGHPFWNSEGWHGYMKADHHIQQTWPDRVDPRSLVAYVCGDAARSLHRAGEHAHMFLTGDLFKVAFTAMTSRIEVKDWIADPFARGGFTTAPPGSNPLAVRQRDDRKVQLAGEFCATWLGFMEGALESAEAAVGALIKKPARG